MLIGAVTGILVVINIAGFVTVAVDKHKSRKKLWRIPERLFFLLALLGGCPGVYAGFLLFRHKTRRWYFMLGIPAIFVLQVLVLFKFLKT